HDNLVYMLSYLPGFDAATIGEENRRWNEQHAAPLAKRIQPHTNEPNPDKRLKIGYVSSDFREHCLSFYNLPLLTAHDHAKFEIVGYSDVPEPDGFTERLRSQADVWHDIARMPDDQVCELIRRDQIDILVDLTMHMERNRLLVFARKPA